MLDTNLFNTDNIDRRTRKLEKPKAVKQKAKSHEPSKAAVKAVIESITKRGVATVSEIMNDTRYSRPFTFKVLKKIDDLIVRDKGDRKQAVLISLAS